MRWQFLDLLRMAQLNKAAHTRRNNGSHNRAFHATSPTIPAIIHYIDNGAA
jgi:hypothetical protein